jgi:hypothetical protein
MPNGLSGQPQLPGSAPLFLSAMKPWLHGAAKGSKTAVYISQVCCCLC